MRYWEILLVQQRERGRHGLTLPFLIGSQNYLPKTHTRQNIEELITDILESKNIEIHIRYCTGVCTLIFEINNQKNNAYYPTYKNEEQKVLSVAIAHKRILGDDVNTLIENLVEQFQSAIDKEYYSAEPDIYSRSANWGRFSYDDDIQFIENCFNRM